MARRALDFATAHPITDAGYTAVVARLRANVAQADTLAMLQDAGVEKERSALARRTSVKRTMRSQQLRRLARIGTMAAVEHPELSGKFTLPKASGPNRTFVLRARTMLADATAQKDLLSSLGLGDTFIEQLGQAVAEFDNSTEAAHASRADHVGASAELKAIATRCTTDVDVIDTFIRSEFVADAQSLAAWQSARNIPGPFTRPKATTTAPDAGTPPSS